MSEQFIAGGGLIKATVQVKSWTRNLAATTIVWIVLSTSIAVIGFIEEWFLRWSWTMAVASAFIMLTPLLIIVTVVFAVREKPQSITVVRERADGNPHCLY